MKTLIDEVPQRHKQEQLKSTKVDRRIERDRLRREEKVIKQNLLDHLKYIESLK